MFESIFRKSGIFKSANYFNIIIKKNYSSAAKAFNEAIDEATTDLLVFAHQDMMFPNEWLEDLRTAISYLSDHDPNWGVLGCFGVTEEKEYIGHVYSFGLGHVVGKSFSKPEEIQTLDEIVLIFRKSSGLKYDPELPYFHYYGTDICMQAQSRGLKNYSISAFCFHLSNPVIAYPKEYYDCYYHVKKRWANKLPIRTTCIDVTRLDSGLIKSKIRDKFKCLLSGNKCKEN
jgi:hypothetical protein